MRVCFFTNGRDNFDSNRGGVQRITRVLKEEFETNGIEVFLLSMPNIDRKLEYKAGELVFPNYIINHIDNIEFLKDVLKKSRIEILINQSSFDPKTLNLLRNANTHCKIISVHHQCVKCLYDRYQEFFRNYRSKIFYSTVDTLNAWWLIKLLFKRRQKYLWNLMLEGSDAVVLYFKSFEKELYDMTGIESSKIWCIPNPAPFEIKAKEDALKKKFLYVGRIVKNQKRIDKLMSLWHLLHDEFEDWTFDIVGDGPFLSTAKRIAQEKKLSRIRFHGTQNPISYWDKADIFTLTSDYEGYGMVLIEAQARGVVPVSFNCFSAISEVVKDGDSGIIVKDDSVETLFEAVKRLIQNEEMIYKMRENGAIQVQKFDKSEIAKKWIKLFSLVQRS